MGFIKFGSRVDVFLPLNANVKVRLNEKVTGGETLSETETLREIFADRPNPRELVIPRNGGLGVLGDVCHVSQHHLRVFGNTELCSGSESALEARCPQPLRVPSALDDRDAIWRDTKRAPTRLLHCVTDRMEVHSEMPRRPSVDQANEREPMATHVRVEQPHRVVAGVHQARDNASTGTKRGEPPDLIRDEQRGVHNRRAFALDDLAQLE